MGRLASLAGNQRPVLTKLAWGYKNPAHIWKEACTPVEVDKMKTSFPKFGLDEFRKYNTARGLGGDSNIIKKEDLTDQDINLKEYELSYPIDVLEDNEAFFSLQKRGQVITTKATSLAIEVDVATLFGTYTNYASGNYETLSGTDQWSDFTDSDPVGDIVTAKGVVRGKIGVDPNAMVMGDAVYRKLIQHSGLKELIKYSQEAILTMDLLKRIFEVKEIHIGKATYAANGATTFTDVYGDFCSLYYKPELAPKKKEDIVEPAFCHTPMLKGYPKVYMYESQNKKVNYINSTYVCRPTILSDVAGYLFLDCVA